MSAAGQILGTNPFQRRSSGVGLTAVGTGLAVHAHADTQSCGSDSGRGADADQIVGGRTRTRPGRSLPARPGHSLHYRLVTASDCTMAAPWPSFWHAFLVAAFVLPSTEWARGKSCGHSPARGPGRSTVYCAHLPALPLPCQ